jgi:hypothetical protein
MFLVNACAEHVKVQFGRMDVAFVRDLEICEYEVMGQCNWALDTLYWLECWSGM